MDVVNKKKQTWEMVLNNFTDDLWTEVLLRLLLKTLLQFKSVSKSWFSIILSHRFALSHLENAAKDDQTLIVHHEIDEDEEKDDDSFSLFHLSSARILKNLKFPYSQGESPPTPKFSKLVGSDCGIVCVQITVNKWPAARKTDIYFWNPATKHSKIIPMHNGLDYNSTMALGFGFDHVDLDFKVVGIVYEKNSPPVCAEVIYSSNRDTWRKIEPKPVDVPYHNDFHLCLHGFLFTTGSNSHMMAFDINKEVFICDIKLPYSSSEDDGSFETRVTDFKDTIAVIIGYMDEGKINLWTLDNEACLRGDGVQASWTIMLNVDVGVSLCLVEGLFNDSQFLLIDEDDERILYNSNMKEITDVCIPLVIRAFFKYTESLISLEGFKPIK